MDVLTNLADQNRALTLVVNTAPGHGWSLAYLNARIMDWCDNEAGDPLHFPTWEAAEAARVAAVELSRRWNR